MFNRYFYFEWNRFYLIAIVFVSIVLPLIKVNWLQESSLHFDANDILFVNPSEGQFFVKQTEKSNFFIKVYNSLTNNRFLNFHNLFLLIYFSGVVRFAIVFLRRNLSISKLKKQSVKINFKGAKIFKTESKITAFSFFKSIFVNQNFENLSEAEKLQIVEHENIHIKQKHTLDNILMEITNIIFWFNPIVRKMQKSVKENHEFIVDKLLTQKDPTYNYSLLMLKLIGKSRKIAEKTTKKSNSQVKSRISLLANPEKERVRKIRFISTMPILALLIFVFLLSFNIQSSYSEDENTQNKEFAFPLKKNYKIVTYYFEDKIISDPNNKDLQYKISHKKLAIQAESFSDVLSAQAGKIVEIDTINNWGIDEIKIVLQINENYKAVYEKLAKCYVSENQQVKKAQQIGQTGDTRLYPTINYQILKNNEPINPLEIKNVE